MKKLCFVALLLVAVSTNAQATFLLQEWGYNHNGSVFDETYHPPTAGGGFLTSITGAGHHNFIAYFDAELDEPETTALNEIGIAHGTAASGQSWEIDEPGWGNWDYYGDIWTNFNAGALDNGNAMPGPDDTAMALGWDFDLLDGETAYLSFDLNDVTRPSDGFYLEQFDPDSGSSLFFSSTLRVVSGAEPVPEPSTFALIGLGLGGLAWYRRKGQRREAARIASL